MCGKQCNSKECLLGPQKNTSVTRFVSHNGIIKLPVCYMMYLHVVCAQGCVNDTVLGDAHTQLTKCYHPHAHTQQFRLSNGLFIT